MTSDDEPGTDEGGDTALGNIPPQLTRLVGREGALNELSSLMWRTRLLSLCGPGGAGKTRLAAALAEAVQADFVGGAWWVDLSATHDPEAVAQVVAAAVLPGEFAIGSAVAAIARHFTDSALLVLDNCEQVIASTAELVIALLSRTQSLRVVATSRQPLGVPGEQVWRVPGLFVSDHVDAGGTDGADAGAVDLFLERAREAASSFDNGDPAVRDAVARICRWLDGMPLSIELAAARVPVLGVGEIAERLERGTGFMRHASRAIPERHRTMTDTLDWSLRMLEPAEQRMFRRLGAFRGSFSLAAAEAVCEGEGLEPDDLLELLSSLVDRSLVQASDDGGPRRYRLLAAVRQYAAALLDDSPDSTPARQRHAAFFEQLAQHARPGLVGGDQVRQLEQLELEHANLLEALQWLLASSPPQAARMASLLWPFWYQRGYYREARNVFEQALAAEPALTGPPRAEALLKAGEVAFLQCDYELAIEHLRGALELIGESGDPSTAATALQRLGSIAREQGHFDEARELHGQSLAIWVQLGDSAGIAASRNYLGFVAWLACDWPTAESLCTEALAEFQRAGNLHDAAGTLVNLGAAALYSGDLRSAGERLEQALAISRRLGFQEGIAWSLHELAILSRYRRRPLREQAQMLRDALLVHRQLGDRWRVASVLEEIAASVLARLDATRALQLFGLCSAAAGAARRPGTPRRGTGPRRRALTPAGEAERLDVRGSVGRGPDLAAR